MYQKKCKTYPNNIVGMKSRPDVESTIGSNLSCKKQDSNTN